MRFRQLNLALEKDDTNRFLPWLIAFMVLLAALSIAGMLMLHQISGVFEHGIQDTMTVQIPAGENIEADEKNVSEALEALKKVDGVLSSNRISAGEISRLLKPWLGETAGSDGLPLPQIIDVEVDRSSNLTAEKLNDFLSPLIPGATVDDHSVWLTSLVDTLHSTELIALSVVFLITLATIGTVVFTTRTGMGIHRQTIEVLHFVGAQDELSLVNLPPGHLSSDCKAALSAFCSRHPSSICLTIFLEIWKKAYCRGPALISRSGSALVSSSPPLP